jgi:polysaccharide pyruvyl transferase WcaK-like protein
MRDFGSATPPSLNALAHVVAKCANEESLGTIFIPHHAPGGVGGDIKLARQVAHNFERSELVILDPIPLASELKAITAEANWVVTMRYHQLVFALSLGIPAVGVSVNPYTHAKLSGAFEQMNLAPLVLPLEQAPERLEAQLAEAKRCRERFAEAARSFGERELPASLAPYEHVAELLNKQDSR